MVAIGKDGFDIYLINALVNEFVYSFSYYYLFVIHLLVVIHLFITYIYYLFIRQFVNSDIFPAGMA